MGFVSFKTKCRLNNNPAQTYAVIFLIVQRLSPIRSIYETMA
jgi:hypothetical protein